ncbi:MAG: CoA transferase, partial [Actinomycetes bacterium]
MRWEIAESNSGTGLPLEGLRVLDLSRVLAGPLCAMVVGDLGADVIKVESPVGDPVRELAPPRLNGLATYYLSVNRHRRNVTLDLSHAKDLAKLEALVAQADAVIENYLPYQRDRFGLEQLRLAHPDVIWVSVTPASGTGPLANEPTFDLLAQARSGLMSVTGNFDGEPT